MRYLRCSESARAKANSKIEQDESYFLDPVFYPQSHNLSKCLLPLLLSDLIDTATVWAFDVSTFEFGGYL